jgi:hypothetical protein
MKKNLLLMGLLLALFIPLSGKADGTEPVFRSSLLGGEWPQSERIEVANKLSISPVYPNPASTQASFDYEFRQDNIKAHITLRNVLGNVVGRYELSRENRQLNITTHDFAPGIYFYTLTIDNKDVLVRRLIVKHQ